MKKVSTEINDRVFELFPVLGTERLLLRTFRVEDADGLLRLRSDPRVLRYLDTAPHRSLADSQKMIEENQRSFAAKEGVNWVLVERERGLMIGYCGIWRLDRAHCRGEIGYGLHPDYWGQGYMREALNAVLEFSFETLQLHSVEANVNPENEASKRLLLAQGFRQEAYFRENYLYNGRFLDSVIFCRLATDA